MNVLENEHVIPSKKYIQGKHFVENERNFVILTVAKVILLL
jgi:hypothetical protein